MEASLKSSQKQLEGLRDQFKKAQDIIKVSEFINYFKDVPFVTLPETLPDFTNVDENFKELVTRYYTFSEGHPGYRIGSEYVQGKDPMWLLNDNNQFSLDKMQDPKYSQYIKDILEAKKKLEAPVADGGFTRLFNSNNNRSNKKIKSKKKKNLKK